MEKTMNWSCLTGVTRIDLTAREADMVVCGLVLFGSDSFRAPLSRFERAILRADLREIEVRVLAAVPTTSAGALLPPPPRGHACRARRRDHAPRRAQRGPQAG